MKYKTYRRGRNSTLKIDGFFFFLLRKLRLRFLRDRKDYWFVWIEGEKGGVELSRVGLAQN